MATAINDRRCRRAQDAEWAARLDGFVERARTAAAALRELDQEAVDRIVWAMVVAGLEHAVELAELAMEETGFGVLRGQGGQELHRHRVPLRLPEGQAVGRRDRRGRRARASSTSPSRSASCSRSLPITNPTSTALFKAIVAAKTRNAMIFRPSARAARCAERARRDPPGGRRGAPGCRRDALQVIPDPTLDVSQYLFHHPGVDFIWTTGGPKAVAAANAAGKPCLSVGPGNAPVYVHRSADVRDGGRRHPDLQDLRRLGDLPGRADLRRRRRDLRRGVAEFERMGARLLDRRRGRRARGASRSTTDGHGRSSSALGQSCVEPRRRWRASRSPTDDKVLLAPLPDRPRRARRAPARRRRS